MRYLLETDHYLWDQYLYAGTEIGDGTPYLLPEGFVPSASMRPLDDDAQALSDKTGKDKLNWGRPDQNFPIVPRAGDNHPLEAVGAINRPQQPIIPPPLEHLTKPNTMKPGEVERPNPLLTKALEEQAAENDRVMAERANAEAKARSDAAPKPMGVTEESAPGQGPKPSVDRKPLPGQGPAPASREVPRNTSGVVPESKDGQPVEKKKS